MANDNTFNQQRTAIAEAASTVAGQPEVQQPLSPVAQARDSHVYVGHVDKVMNIMTGQFLSLTSLARRFSVTGDDVSELVAELLHAERGLMKVDTVAFEPGLDRVFVDENSTTFLNLWSPPNLAPVAGDVTPLIKHLNLIFDQDQTAVTFFTSFMAHMIQKPEQKLMCAPLLIGGQGIGKSLLGEFFSSLIGAHNTASIDASSLTSQFNDYAQSHLIIINEFSSAVSKAARAMLKGLITSPTIFLNRKNVPAIPIANRTNLLMFSNDHAALPLERDDRRYFVWISRAQRQPQEYYATLAAWMQGEGAAHTLHYLQNFDLTDFNPNAAPPTNASREALIQESMSDQHQLLQELFEAGEAPFTGDLVVTSDVVEYLNSQRGPRFTVRQVAAFLQQVQGAALGQCRLTESDGSTRKPRVWAVRNVDSWVGRLESDIARAYRKPGLPVPVAPTSANGSGLDRPRPNQRQAPAQGGQDWETPQL
ncbi:hypothetical protein ABIC99_003864 [Sphaerotilus sulfidivorans]|uniref:NrS-1 polymerase-like helicase domain-containing protein n=1 Tax=Sphaerotilus sulfidivorans TaxID=639200 RepID=A0A5C1Q469_9BURK|nr:primase-helicase family protein [Sphaerotilus sulfidivorans]NZD47829.1 hypothetical protein [Sphaerotilus sulfidivorans]QEN01669.1 hypothetical protein EWH46_13375 [Sphaerotilus sulfidivorans]